MRIESDDVLVAFIFGFVAALFAAWGTHVGWIITKLAGAAGPTIGQCVLAVVGIFVPPVGVIHGVMIWLGIGM